MDEKKTPIDEKIQKIADSYTFENLKMIKDENSKNIEKNIEITNSQKNFLNKEKAINGFKKLMEHEPNPGQEFCVIVYFLTDEISPDGSRGFWFLIGTYTNPKKAIKVAEEIIRDTGISNVYAMKTCSWQSINDVYLPNRIKFVDPNLDKNLINQHKKEYDKLVKDFKDQKSISDEIESDQEETLNKDSVQYYTRQWYLLIKQYLIIEKLKSDLAKYEKTYNEQANIVKKNYELHPEHEENFLNILKPKLEKRGETLLYTSLSTNHKILKSEILK